MLRLSKRLLMLSIALAAAAASAQVVRQATDELTSGAGGYALDDLGTTVFAGASIDPFGTNPDHASQLFEFSALLGTPTQITAEPRGTSAYVSVTDDGQWLAFGSPSDLTGQNHDRSVELYVIRRDGTQTRQLTNHPAVNAGDVTVWLISGDGSRLVFLANTDPLGTNPDQRNQLFAIDFDGTNLVQLTAFTTGSIGGFSLSEIGFSFTVSSGFSLSDDGSRVAFYYDGDPTGGNADLGDEIFTINADGTGLTQLTSTPAGFGSGTPSLSGNGNKIAFESNGDLVGSNAANQTEIFSINWDGTALTQVTQTVATLGFTGDPAATSPSITDDGLKVFYQTNFNQFFVNFDGNFEIFSSNTDGTGRSQVTSTLLSVGSLFPVVSGDGSRVAYVGVSDAIRLQVEASSGGELRQLVDFDVVFLSQEDISPDGTRIVFTRTPGVFGGGQIWRVESDGSDRAQITSVATGSPASPSISGDNDTLVFSASSNPLSPSNDDLSEEIFLIRADGTGLAQLTSGPADTSSEAPVFAAGGTMVAFESNADLGGANPDGSTEIYRVLPDGTGVQQLTSGPPGTVSRRPRIDASGTWIVFESNADLDGGNPDGSYEIHRVRTDGGGLERLTGDPLLDSRSPDVSNAGDKIVFHSEADLLGSSNPEANREIFIFEPGTATLRQLTSSVEGSSTTARISGDGSWVYFGSTAPFFEAHPNRPSNGFRVPAGGGAIERVGALRDGFAGPPAPDDTGNTAVFSGIGDFTEQNPDLLDELWVIDRTAAPEFTVGKPSPTVLSWTHNSGPLRYDVIRGDVAALAFAAGDVDLGPVVCLEDDSPDATTAGFGDALDPGPGQAFFFVYRGTQGLLSGPGSYGASSGGGERIAASGDCAP